MKNFLYGTTALVAAGVMVSGSASAAEKIKLKVGGYFQAMAVYVDQDSSLNRRDNYLIREGEIIFAGSTTLDNGLKVGVNVQLEAETCGDQIDESYIFFSGSWGQVIIGAEDAAANKMQYGQVGGVAVGVASPNFGFTQGGTIFTGPGILTDSEKLTYFTPRMSGFQVGVSYTPDKACEAATNCSNYSGSNKDDGTDGTIGSVYSIAANWVGNFQSASVAVFASYERGEDESNTATTDDNTEWSIGGEVGFNGFKVGGQYTDEDNDGGTKNSDNKRWTVGAQYGTGPWAVGIQYAKLDAKAANSDKDAVSVEGSYVLGPGVSVVGGVHWWDVDAQPDNAVAVFVGTKLGF